MSDVYDHPEYRALLAAVCAAPDDDLPRMVLADWLEENGEGERAEWIRVQVERAKTPDRAECDRCRREWSSRRFSSYPVPMGWCDSCRTIGPFWPDVQRSFHLRRREKELRHKWPRCWTDADERAGLNTYGDRGFVDRVSGPLAVLIGGGCSCGVTEQASERYAIPRYSRHCPDCRGTGRTPGVLGPLLRREPVGEDGIVVTTGGVFRPFNYTDGTPGVAVERNALPADVWTELCRQCDITDDPLREPFPTPDAARQALSRALFALHAPKSEGVTA